MSYPKKSHCKKGHEFTPENTYVTPAGKRQCRECNRVSCRRRRAASPGVPPSQRRWQKGNPQRVRDYRRRWASKNPECHRATMRRRRARKLSQLGDWILPESEFIALLFETYPYCYYCEEPLISGFHVDHKIPLSRPELLQAGRKGLHEPWNLRLSCPGCNMSKGNRTAEEFRQTHGTAS